MKKKCYIYIRVSTTMQVDGYSLEAQKERLMKFAEFQEMEVGREYCDAGKSGKSITGRPEFQRMLQDVSEERDGVAFILVFKLSRFGRNAADVLNSLQFIQDYGVVRLERLPTAFRTWSVWRMGLIPLRIPAS